METLIVLSIIEAITSGVAWFGFKMARDKQQLQGINKSISLPFIDKFLAKRIGHTTSLQRYRAKKMAGMVRTVSRYRSFELLLLAKMASKPKTKLKKGGK